MILKDKLFEKIQEHRPRTVRLLKEHGDTKLCDVTIAQAICGARGVRCLVTDVSYLDPFEGIRFRGMTIPETFEALENVPGCDYPHVESFFYLLMTGELPSLRTHVVTHVGPYRHLGNAWSTAMQMARGKELLQSKKHPPFESYVDSPEETAERDLRVDVHIPVR